MVPAWQARTTERLATGKRVNLLWDDPSAYFAAEPPQPARTTRRPQGPDGRSDPDREGRPPWHRRHHEAHRAGQGSRRLRPFGSAADRSSLADQFDALRTQIDQMAADGSYKGTNFLASNSPTVDFNEDGSSSPTVSGFDA